MTDQTTTNNLAIVCNVNAIDAVHREQHGMTTQALFAAVRDIQEFPVGYAFRLPEEMLVKGAEFIAYERLCCPFFNFSLEVEPNGGPIWLRLTGSEEIKQLIRVELGGLLNDHLAHQMGVSKRTGP